MAAIPSPNTHPRGELLPKWTPESQVFTVASALVNNIERSLQEWDYQANRCADELINETEAFLEHEAEGW